uniref:Very-long-chain enoyl-CoA reductase-like n=1 Tax=Tanacetum cinerariifolium TaxID=118510 RepID=A0A6L2P6B2_TANCI|nr:very-long-chain enoyl-CoA reductase-like [Tanacetum cinerariifolium]
MNIFNEFPYKDMKEELPGCELFALPYGPSQTPIPVNSCVVNGVRFVVHSRVERHTTQNNGIFLPGLDGEMYYDDNIIDEEDPIPHDLVDSNDEDLVNLDIDDGVNMSADVAQGHGDDGGSDDRPHPYQILTGCGCCLVNRVWRQRDLMPLGDHAAHWANYLGELVRELPLHYPSWRQMPSKRKAGVMAKIETQFDLRPHMKSDRWLQIYAGIQQHLQKIYNGKKAAFKESLSHSLSTMVTVEVAGARMMSREMMRTAARMGRMGTIVRRCWNMLSRPIPGDMSPGKGKTKKYCKPIPGDMSPGKGIAETIGNHLEYSKFAISGNKPVAKQGVKISSRTGMLILYTPAFLAGLASFFVLPGGDLRLVLLKFAVTVHFFKRDIEVLFVHKYSGNMILGSIILISVFYFYVAIS